MKIQGKKAPKQVATRQPVWPIVAQAALRTYLAPRLAQDADLDLKPLVAAFGTPRKLKNGTVTGLNFQAFRDALTAALAPASGKAVLAADADVADVQDVISQLEDMAPQVADLLVGGADPMTDEPPADPTGASPPDTSTPPGDDPAGKVDPDGDGEAENAEPIAQVMAFLADKLSPEDLDSIKGMLAGKQKEKTEVAKDSVTQVAMDAAIDSALKKQSERYKAARAAEIAVRPYTGQLRVAFDSADEVYKFALAHLKVDVKGVDPSAFPAILKAQPLPGGPRLRVAMDAAGGAERKPVDFGEHLSRIVRA